MPGHLCLLHIKQRLSPITSQCCLYQEGTTVLKPHSLSSHSSTSPSHLCLSDLWGPLPEVSNSTQETSSPPWQTLCMHCIFTVRIKQVILPAHDHSPLNKLFYECHGLCMRIPGQNCEIGSLLPPFCWFWAQLRPPGTSLYPLSHLLAFHS